MKYFLFLVVFLGAISGFAQVNVTWEELPEQSKNAAQIVYQTKTGILVAKTHDYWYPTGYAISNDSAKTWNTLWVEWDYQLNFFENENGVLFYHSKKRVYQLVNPTDSIFNNIYTTQNEIYSAVTKDNKLFMSILGGIYIYDIKNNKIISEPIKGQTYYPANKILLGKNKNYAVGYFWGPHATFTIFTPFDDNGNSSKEIWRGGEIYEDIRLLNSGKFITNRYNKILTSSDTIKTWTYIYNLPPTATGYITSMIINEKDEILILANNKLLISKDEGKIWQEIPTPKGLLHEGVFPTLFSNLNNQITIANFDSRFKSIYTTSDLGKSWSAYKVLLDLPNSDAVKIAPTGEIINKNGFFNEFIDEKLTKWNDISAAEKYNFSQILTLKNGKWLGFNDTNEQYYLSSDKGKQWAIYDKFPSGIIQKKVFENQLHELIILQDGKIYNSKDAVVWTEQNAPNLNIDSLKVEKVISLNNTIVFSATSAKSTNVFYYKFDTQTMGKYIAPKGYSVFRISVNTLIAIPNDEIVFIANCQNINDKNYNFFMVSSKDFGNTYNINRIPLDTYYPPTDLVYNINKKLFVLSDAKATIWVSPNKGVNWKWLNYHHYYHKEIGNISVDENSNLLYVACKNGLIVRTDLKKLVTLNTTVFVDKNANCVKDIDEESLQNTIISIKASNKDYLAASDSKGKNTFLILEDKELEITPRSSFVYEPCQKKYFIPIDSLKDSFKLDIPLKIINDCALWEISGGVVAVRRCFSSSYGIRISNNGTSVQKTTVKVTLDSLYDFESATLPILSKLGQTIIFDAGNVKSNTSKSFSINFKVSCKANLGQTHCMKVEVNSEKDCIHSSQANSQFVECRENTGSYDPNDKTAFVNGIQNAEQVKAGQKLEYLVRFQNTGTDTAFTVVIKDPISSNLDVSSIVMGASSHRYTWEVKENVLIVRFDNIMLPDSNKSERNSHGFIKFRINPKANITHKNLINNTAAIYFDYNEPVLTNEVVLNKKTIKTKDFSLEDKSFLLYPNPANELLHLQWTSAVTVAFSSVSIYSLEGKLLMTKFFDTLQTDLQISTLPKGLYLVKLQNGQVIKMKKFVKM